ncbi:MULTISPECIES: glycosyl transferase family 90 [Aphanothece]|uniref:glycosyl transferase family 90 n=1 Tax=Aphanothece TaxID=1121 RepID=UPI00398E86B5
MPNDVRLRLRPLEHGRDRDPLTLEIAMHAGSEMVAEVGIQALTFRRNLLAHKGRIKECLQAWMPFFVRIYSAIGSRYVAQVSAGDAGEPGVLSMDGLSAGELIPDLYSMRASRNGNYLGKAQTFSRFKSAWILRKPLIFWRGGTTGIGAVYPIDDLNSLKDNLRVRLCLAYRDTAHCDIKLSRLVQLKAQFCSEAKSWLEMQSILSEQVPESEFRNYKYYPDIPGNCLAWGTIYKHLSGCLVFRPPSCRQLYYYRFMQAWRHFVPVLEDYSDLVARQEWCERHPDQAAWIAWMGYRAANRYVKTIGGCFVDAVLSGIKQLDAIEI